MHEIIYWRIRIPDKKNTTTSELIIENQWICTSFIPKYISQREAQLTSDLRHSTEYVNHNWVECLLTGCGLGSLENSQASPLNFNSFM